VVVLADCGEGVDLHEASDFAIQTTAFPLSSTDTIGQGMETTVYRMRPLTSTRAPVVDALTNGDTNPYHLMRWFTFPSWRATNPEIGGFTVQGTPQGHPYNAIQVGYSDGAYIHDVKITGIPGYSPSPPGETFAFSLWHADDALVEDCVADGRVDDQGTVGVSASLFDHSYTKNTTHRRCLMQYANAGFGSASYECTGETWEDSRFLRNRKHLNIERTFGGTFRYTRCDFAGASVPYVAQVSTDPRYGSARVIFEDCTVDGDGILRVRVYGKSSVNSQEDADIRCIRNGVDVTDDPSRFRLVG
jgi:hypothetical protein